MKHWAITIGLVGGLLTPALQGGVAAARSEVEAAAEARELPALEFAEELREEVFWVEGRLAARAIRADLSGCLTIEGEWPGVPADCLHFRPTGQAKAGWIFSGPRGQRLFLRSEQGGSLLAEIRSPGQPVRRERWLRNAPVEADLRVSQRGSEVEVRFELRGSPLDLELAVVSEDPRFAALGGLVYLESLGRLPLGRHALVWAGRDRSAAADPLPPGTYRVELRERLFLPAPGSQPIDPLVTSAHLVVTGPNQPH